MQQTEHTHSNKIAAHQFGAVIPFCIHEPKQNFHTQIVAFNKFELQSILNVYSRKVACGDWKDYTIDCLKNRAIFSIFRKSADVALYRFEKIPENTNKQGQYSLYSAAGLILKRGHNLEHILKYFAEKPKIF